jgi:glycosidase
MDEIIYHIFIDRFAGFDKNKDDSQPQRIGGNIKAIIKKLPYLKKLGVTCIWLSPFYKAESYHGYDILDFFKVDEAVGTEKDLEDLIAKAHKIDIKIIADFVPNHCSEHHPFFVDAKSSKDSKYRNWFYFKNWPDDYLCFLDWKHLPKINLENKEARKYMLEAASYWLAKGLDGFRIDHAIGVPKEFLKELVKIAKDKFLLGEVWFFGVDSRHAETIKGINLLKVIEESKRSGSSLEDEAIKELDTITGFLDFTFNSLIKQYLKGSLSGRQFFSNLQQHYKKLDFILPSFLDNHDMNRLIFELGNDKELYKIASVLQFSMSQPPIIYYGNEIGLSQAMRIEELPSHGDVQARRRMEWEEQDEDLLEHYKRLCFLRKRIKAMREGEAKLFYTDDTRLLAFTKEGEDRLLVIVNPDNAMITFNLNLAQINARYLVDLFEDRKIENTVHMRLEPKGFKMFLIR